MRMIQILEKERHIIEGHCELLRARAHASIIIITIMNKRVRRMHICNVTPNSTPFEVSESIVSVDCNTAKQS